MKTINDIKLNDVIYRVDRDLYSGNGKERFLMPYITEYRVDEVIEEDKITIINYPKFDSNSGKFIDDDPDNPDKFIIRFQDNQSKTFDWSHHAIGLIRTKDSKTAFFINKADAEEYADKLEKEREYLFKNK